MLSCLAVILGFSAIGQAPFRLPIFGAENAPNTEKKNFGLSQDKLFLLSALCSKFARRKRCSLNGPGLFSWVTAADYSAAADCAGGIDGASGAADKPSPVLRGSDPPSAGSYWPPCKRRAGGDCCWSCSYAVDEPPVARLQAGGGRRVPVPVTAVQLLAEADLFEADHDGR